MGHVFAREESLERSLTIVVSSLSDPLWVLGPDFSEGSTFSSILVSSYPNALAEIEARPLAM